MQLLGLAMRAATTAQGRTSFSFNFTIRSATAGVVLALFISSFAHAQTSGNSSSLPTATASDGFYAIGATVSSDGGASPPFTGLVINDVVGATTYYSQGFVGINSTIANVEAGAIWNGHETLGQVTTYVQDTVSPGPQTGEFDLHATLVGSLLAGRSPGIVQFAYQAGIAFGANLWSGSIATQWEGPPYSTSFDVNLNSFANPYKAIMVTGVNGSTADVINSSWGFDDSTGAAGDMSRVIDALVAMSGKVFVTSAGNGGPDADTVGSPAAGYNKISVGALTSDTSSPPYSTVADFSSRGPSDVFNPATNQTLIGVRASVDIVAPGTDLTLAYYGGATGGNNPSLGTPQGLQSGNDFYAFSAAGTSFSSPIVAGGAALVVDAARNLFPLNDKAIDGRVVKAILLNSADKIAGWNNGQAVNGSGVIETTQSLDYSSGAGALNLSRAYIQQTGGTTDVSGLGGGFVQPIGWDYGEVHFHGKNDYVISTPMTAGTTLTVTLDWFIQRTIDLVTNNTAESEFSNLDLQVWRANGGTPQLVATSDSIYNNVEHLSFLVPDDDLYSISVVFSDVNWNLSATLNDNLTEDYGLAWSDINPVPEPGTFFLLLISMGAIATARQWTRQRF